MEESELLSSVETAIERTNSAVWDLSDRSKQEKKEAKAKKAEAKKTKWAGQGLAIDESGSVPKTRETALKHAIKELLRGLLRGYGLGFMLKGGLNFVFALLQRKSFSVALQRWYCMDTRRFSRFVGTFIGLFRFSNVIAAFNSGEDKPLNSAYAGAIASLAIIFDDKSRREGIALYLFVRSIDVLVKKLARLGTLPYWKHFEAFMFGVSNIPIMYGFLYDPSIVQPGYYKWILGMGNVTHDGLQEALRDRLAAVAKGEDAPFCNCSVGYHEGPCPHYIFKDWFLGLGRAGRIYLPVHLIPMIIFRYNSLLSDPSSTLLHTFKAFVSSCMFLTSYQSIVKGNCCFWRNLLQRDEWWQGCLSGFLTSFATSFERKSRVSELMLYCWPRALESTWKLLLKRGMVRNIPNGEVVLFAFAATNLMSIERQDFKDTYHKALCYLVGYPLKKTENKEFS
mmetsp:Transcript_3964/g.4451  ORF Transcript_3964/g.4451 Transcript_3964/m.4451 type:complete len:452 (+) Transcript_3964:135-1490(+)